MLAEFAEGFHRLLELLVVGERNAGGARLQVVLGKDETSIRYVADRLGHDLRYAIDATKVSTELGWKPKHDFESGLAATVEWYKANEKWWRPLKKVIA